MSNTLKACNVSSERVLVSKRQMMAMNASQSNAYLRRIGADRSSQTCGAKPISEREDINMFVVDSGINNLPGLNIVGGYSSSGSDYLVDTDGHGTHIASIIGANDPHTSIRGVVPGARLWSVKITSEDTKLIRKPLLQGLDWILEGKGSTWKGTGIVNISFTGKIDPYIDKAVNDLVDNGIIVCVSAGNYAGNASLCSPAHLDSAITVGAIYQPGYTDFAPFSNCGPSVDILAPGSEIYAFFNDTHYAKVSGTSMACPIVAGVVALLVSSNKVAIDKHTAGKIKTMMIETSSQTITKNYDKTVEENKRINLTQRTKSFGTTDVCVRAGCF